MVTIELNYEESLKYFDEDQETTRMIEGNENAITEVRIEDNHVMYRIGTPNDIGSATWIDDDYEGATNKLSLMGKMEAENEYCTHEIITPTIDYETCIYLSDGYHEHCVNGSWIDGHTYEIKHYEELIDEYVRANLQNNDKYYTDLIFVIDENDNVTLKGN